MSRIMAPVDVTLPDGGTVRVVVQEYIDRFAITGCVAHPNNPQVGRRSALFDSITTLGFYGAGLVLSARVALFGVMPPAGKRWILCGAHRWTVMREAKCDDWPVLLVQCDAATAERILLSDNRSRQAARTDEALLTQLLDALVEQGVPLEGLGMSAEEIEETRDFAAAGTGMGGFLDTEGLGADPDDKIPDDRKIKVRVSRPHYTAAVADALRAILASDERWKGVTLRSGF